jgi:hypothetical protein
MDTNVVPLTGRKTAVSPVSSGTLAGGFNVDFVSRFDTASASPLRFCKGWYDAARTMGSPVPGGLHVLISLGTHSFRTRGRMGHERAGFATRRRSTLKTCLVVAIAMVGTLFAQEPTKALDATLTLYSAPGSTHRTTPGRRPWAGLLWIDHQRVTRIKVTPGHFLALRLPNGSHLITGWNSWGHESDAETPISLDAGRRYFVRLEADSHVVAGFGGTSYFGELVTCEEARRDAAALEPIKLKHFTEAFLGSAVRESYFPECDARK